MRREDNKMNSFTKIALTVALIGGVSATALSVNSASAKGWNNGRGMGPEQAQSFHGPRGMLDLKAIDADQDGSITKDELSAAMGKKISDNDTNSDEAVSLEEFKAEWMAMTKNRMVRTFQFFDRDGDGKVTLEEFSDPAQARFDRMDVNNDGKVDSADRQAMRGKGMRGKGHGPDFGKRGFGHHGRDMKGPRGGQFQQGQFGPQGGPRGGMMGGPRGGQFQQGQFQQAPAPQMAPTAAPQAPDVQPAQDSASTLAPALPPVAMAK